MGDKEEWATSNGEQEQEQEQLATGRIVAAVEMDALDALRRLTPMLEQFEAMPDVVGAPLRQTAATLGAVTRLVASTQEGSEAAFSTDDLREKMLALSNVPDVSHFDPGTALILQTVVQCSRLLLAMAAANECQLKDPFAPMHQVRKPNGKIVWRCSHDPAHES